MDKFYEIFSEFGKIEKIPTLPFLPIFRKSKEGPFYFARDMHWNKEGLRLAAESIFNFLKQKEFIY